MEDLYGHRIRYLRVSVTDRCNERCRYCMPDETQEWLPRDEVLTYDEFLRVLRVVSDLGVRRLRITGGEPLTRPGITPFLEQVCAMKGIEEVGVSTNGTLLAARDPSYRGRTIAESLVKAGVTSVNISLDTLDREAYAKASGRDYLPKVLDGIEAAISAGFTSIKLNSVLMLGSNETQLLELVDYARERELLLRFIELMPVSSREVLNEENFLSAARAKRIIELCTGPLKLRTDIRTNGPATYYEVPGNCQMLGFISAMTDLHFCESCNKLRLTCEGKLRPCLGNHLEFDLREKLRNGASDDDIARFFHHVVANKPKEHLFRDNYEPMRKMIAIGG